MTLANPLCRNTTIDGGRGNRCILIFIRIVIRIYILIYVHILIVLLLELHRKATHGA